MLLSRCLASRDVREYAAVRSDDTLLRSPLPWLARRAGPDAVRRPYTSGTRLAFSSATPLAWRQEEAVMKGVKTALLANTFLLAALSTGATEETVNIRVSSSVATAPATVVVTATVPPDEQNRSLAVVAESDEFLRSSTIELDGLDEARVHQFWLKSLPEGHYVVTALVRGTDGVRGFGRTTLDVVGGDTRDR
jgi:hypothetical protein